MPWVNPVAFVAFNRVLPVPLTAFRALPRISEAGVAVAVHAPPWYLALVVIIHILHFIAHGWLDKYAIACLQNLRGRVFIRMILSANDLSQAYVKQMADLGHSVFVIAISGLPDVESESDEEGISLCVLPSCAAEMPGEDYLNFALKRIGQASVLAYDLFRKTGVEVVEQMTDDENVIASVQQIVDEMLPPREMLAPGNADN
jgi:hypothetical protein